MFAYNCDVELFIRPSPLAESIAALSTLFSPSSFFYSAISVRLYPCSSFLLSLRYVWSVLSTSGAVINLSRSPANLLVVYVITSSFWRPTKRSDMGSAFLNLGDDLLLRMPPRLFGVYGRSYGEFSPRRAGKLEFTIKPPVNDFSNRLFCLSLRALYSNWGLLGVVPITEFVIFSLF